MSPIKLTLVLAAITAQVMAQAPPASAEFEVVVDTGDSPLPAWLDRFFQPREPPCHRAIQKNGCTGSPREIAMCLAGSPMLSSDCTATLFQQALSNGDAQLLEMLAHKVQVMLSPTAADDKPLVVATEELHGKSQHHGDHHKNDGHVHPIVEHLRQACATEFSSGTCSFATAEKKVCPRKLLRCLVEHRKELGEQCTFQAQNEIARVSETDRRPMNMFLRILAWVLMLMALFACCRCCMRCIRMCCLKSAVGYQVVETDPVIVQVEPSAPMMNEDDELQMALMISAAEADGQKVVDGIAVNAHSQV